VGPRTFTKIFEVPKVSWRPTAFVARGLVEGSQRAPPMPVQRSAPEDGRLKRWYDSRFVLLTWPGLEVSEETKAPTLGQYELQASEAPNGSPEGSSPDGGSPTSNVDGTSLDVEGRAWWPCSGAKGLVLDGVPCLAVRDLPFLVGQFRLFDASRQRAGPASRLMVSIYEAVVPAPVAELQALGKIAPRTLGINIKVSLAAPGGTQLRATLQQVRFRPIGSGVEGRWEELEPAPLDSANRGGSEVSILVREEDGLELGPAYEFCVRVGDSCRLGPWSDPSRPHKFAVASPVPPEASGIRVAVEAEQVQLSWPAFQPEATLALRMPGFLNLPIEYTIAVYGGSCDEPVNTFVTRETEAIVRSLAPGAAYSAVLSARWTRFGTMGPDGTSTESSADKKKTRLMAAFVTGHSPKRIIAELSLRGHHGSSNMSCRGDTAVASIPVDGNSPSAVTLDLDPYWASAHAQHTFMRKPTVPPSPRLGASPTSQASTALAPLTPSRFAPAGEDADRKGVLAQTAEDAPLSGRPLLPTLVPMPPPKFTTRDPLSYAPLIDVPSSPTKSPHRPSPHTPQSARGSGSRFGVTR